MEVRISEHGPGLPDIRGSLPHPQHYSDRTVNLFSVSLPVLSVRRPSTRHRLRTQARNRCLMAIPLQSSVRHHALSQSVRLALLNARSIANKSFILNELFTRKSLDFMFLTETWQRKGEFVHLNELFPAGCSVTGAPCLAC